ncbi:MAG: large-conductance mechanosensitive channel protein MscL [Proteobacteria bacterium]|nr:large-conductance mechanosensitive channel protein MscL [Pseudomonadota bacterium]
MGMMSEFKDFALKGNVVDMAVGIIVGAAFGKIVASLVADIIMPPIGLALGGVDFSDLAVVLQEAHGDIPAVTLNHGAFIMTIIDFLIVAFAMFMAIKAMNAAQKMREGEPEEAAPEAPPEPSAEEKLLVEIRDLLAKK